MVFQICLCGQAGGEERKGRRSENVWIVDSIAGRLGLKGSADRYTLWYTLATLRFILAGKD